MARKAKGHTADTITPMMMELARAELAAMTAALKFWGGWVQSADKYTRGIGSELDRASSSGVNAREFVGRLTDLTRGYLREMVDLPNVAMRHFADEMEHVGAKASRTRRARAKA
jgi:hypothetical protein